MTRDEARREMETVRSSAETDATALKNSQLVLEELHAHYQSLDPADRLHAQAVLIEWALSSDEKLRFDALAIIDDFAVVAATPALVTLANRLGSSTTPGAAYEAKKVQRLLARLGSL
jgi:hypothetical protein